jgi:hypothetical protein
LAKFCDAWAALMRQVASAVALGQKFQCILSTVSVSTCAASPPAVKPPVSHPIDTHMEPTVVLLGM